MMASGHQNFHLPLLMAIGNKDLLVSFKDATAWFELLPSKDKTLKIYEGGFHERTQRVPACAPCVASG